MSVAQDKKATVEFITDGVAIKERVGAEVCSSDTVTTCTNIIAVGLFNGMNSDSTGTSRAIIIGIGETAPTGEYANAGEGSLFFVTGASGAGALYIMTSGAWAAVTHA